MAWQLWQDVPGPPHSSLHICWPIWNGGESTTISYALMHRCEWHLRSRENEGARWWLNATGHVLQRWQREEPIGAGQRGKCCAIHYRLAMLNNVSVNASD